jgi:hypothetical protein
LLDAAGLRGRLLYSSYTPTRGESGYAPMLAALDSVFADHQHNGKISFNYRTDVFYGLI